MPEPLLLLHGFTQTGRGWDAVVHHLGPERYRCAAPDLRGHGAASARRPADMASCTADVLAVADGLATSAGAGPGSGGHGAFTLAGYSMGGRLALHVALAAPERIRRLVLVSATAGIDDAAARERRRRDDEDLATWIERHDIGAVARRWGRQPLFAGQTPAVAAAARMDRLRNEPAGLAASLRGMGTGTMAPLWDRLGELRVPVAVLAGERDAKFVELGRRLAAALPTAKLTVVPGAGHALHLEDPRAVAAAIAGAPIATGRTRR